MSGFAEKVRQVGEAIWLLLLYAEAAAAGRVLMDAEAAQVLGVSQMTISEWRDLLAQSGLVSIAPLPNGRLDVALMFDRDLESFLSALAGEGAGFATLERDWPAMTSQWVQ